MSGLRRTGPLSNGPGPHDDDDVALGSTAILQALSADGDLSWLANVGNVTDMFKRLSQVIEDVRDEAQRQVQEDMDRSLAQVKVALNETVEVSSQRNEQLEMAVAAAEKAFQERDEARKLLREANKLLGEVTSRQESGGREGSSSELTSLRHQLRESQAHVETYQAALKDSQAKLEGMAREAKAKDVRIQELETSASAGREISMQISFLKQQVEKQRAGQLDSREAHEEAISNLKAQLHEAQDRLAAAEKDMTWLEASSARLERSKEVFHQLVSHQQESIEQLRAEFLEQHQSDTTWSGARTGDQLGRQAASEVETASLSWFHVQQLRALLEDVGPGLKGRALNDVGQDMRRAVEGIADTILSDTRRLAQYEAHIERLSTELMEARKQTIEMRESPVSQEQLQEMQRQVGVHKKKEARLEARIAELDALLERRTSQMHAADLTVTELKRKNATTEAQLAAIRSARMASAPFFPLGSQDREGHLEEERELQQELYEQPDEAGGSISISKLATEVEEMKIFRHSAEELLHIMRVQLEQASDRNQELEEKTRQLTHDRDDLQDEIRRMRDTLRASHDLDSAHHRGSLHSSRAVPSDADEDGGDTDADDDDPAALRRPRTAPSSARPPLHTREGLNSIEPEVPPAVMARAAEYAGDEGFARPRSASPSTFSRNSPGEVPAPPEVIERAAMYSGEEGDTRPLTAAPSRRPDAAVAAPQADTIPVVSMAELADRANPSDGECSCDNISVDLVVPAADLGPYIPSGMAGTSRDQECPAVRQSLRPPGRGSGEARALAAKLEADADRRQQREFAIQRLRAEREQDRRAGSTVLRDCAMDEEVVMRALRRAGLVQEEFRQRSTRRASGFSRKRTSKAAASVKAATRHTVSSSGRYISPQPDYAIHPRSMSAGRVRSTSAGRARVALSQSTGKQRAVSPNELVNPAGILMAGTNAQNEDRWVWSRFNPSKPFNPASFSSVLRSRAFDDCMRHHMVASKPRTRDDPRRS
mmetsp:Transcript_33119/g.93750  ORF Transcript_33119/g.93750 Transcript_33119/m.93750 type:complete len:998 (+) Transcript_33119:473-3466(+)|eukprot:CAMPEP_0117651756 /NCGR_PEP_ID=MMETSP0804-20121206/2263_1 /TAXON_ID=1074897 /ORGANISM="Tetraselmis astigmatica, Strain CCMP880" /LENGTH=997 /DNA_ID=CAMNT_0005457757 /DNA_START=408 /DNA_END=3401 /DNA_ORIENTATION=-